MLNVKNPAKTPLFRVKTRDNRNVIIAFVSSFLTVTKDFYVFSYFSVSEALTASFSACFGPLRARLIEKITYT
jgi:hypothetical protein